MLRLISRRCLLNRSVPTAAAALTVSARVFDGTLAWAVDNQRPVDLLLTGGTVVDGSGEKRFASDVAIRDGRIEKVGQVKHLLAKQTINAKGLIIAPGFIDVHTHSDRTLLKDPLAQSAVRQGVTTHIIGNCGDSPAPVPQLVTVGGKTFRTYGEYLGALAEAGISINVCGLVGHNTIRSTVMGFDRRRPTKLEMSKMKEWVAEAMRSGAVGMSTGLVSPPGAYSETEEIIELAKVVAKMGGLYASHIRGEARTLVRSVQEALRIGQEAGLPVQISHHKAAGKENWGNTRHTLRMIEEANRKGQQVRIDVYPYRAGSAELSQLVPPWAHEGGRKAMIDRLKNPTTRKRIVHDMTVGSDDWPNFFVIDWNDIQIAGVTTSANKKWVGKKVADLARARDRSGVEACIDLLIEEDGAARMVNFVMNESEVRKVLKHPLSMIGSDGTAVSPQIAEGKPHPRFYGCFPRVLGHYCRQEKLFSLETAIHKMTEMPARQFALSKRGLLKDGYTADLVLFDEKKIIDKATFDEPHQYPAGIDTVIVGGQLVMRQGKHLGTKSGKIVRPSRV